MMEERKATMPLPLLPEDIRADLAEAALKGFFLVTALWRLDQRQEMALLGQPPRATFFAWKEGGRAALGRDTLQRICCVMAIWKGLKLLLPEPARALAWMREPNASPLFEGLAPLDLMARGRVLDLADVRRLLDAHMGVG